MMQRQHLTKMTTTNCSFIHVDRDKEYRCAFCGRKLFLGNIGTSGKIEIKCTRCKRLNSFERLN